MCLWLTIWRTPFVTKRPYSWVRSFELLPRYISYRRLSTRVGLRRLWTAGLCPILPGSSLWTHPWLWPGQRNASKNWEWLTHLRPDCTVVNVKFSDSHAQAILLRVADGRAFRVKTWKWVGEFRLCESYLLEQLAAHLKITAECLLDEASCLQVGPSALRCRCPAFTACPVPTLRVVSMLIIVIFIATVAVATLWHSLLTPVHSWSNVLLEYTCV